MLNLLGVSHKTDSSFPPANKHGFIKIDYPFFALNPGPLPGPECFCKGQPWIFKFSTKASISPDGAGSGSPEPNKDTQNTFCRFYRNMKSNLVISYWTVTLPLIRTASNQLRLPPLGPAAAIDSHGGPRRRRAFAFLTWRCDPEPALGGVRWAAARGTRRQLPSALSTLETQ